MTTYSIIKKSEIVDDLRLDAEFYQELLLFKQVEKFPKILSLAELSLFITQGPNPSFVESGIFCLTGRNIVNEEINFVGSDIVSREYFESMKRFHLKEGDILITLKGAGSTGKVALFQSSEKAMFSRNIGLIRIDKNKISEKYLFAFLISKIGQKIIDRGVTGGTGQLTLGTGYLKNLQIPIPSLEDQEKIGELVNDSLKLNKTSKEIYSQAENFLLEEVGYKRDIEKGNVSFTTVNFSEVEKAGRMDAEYFQGKFQIILDRINKKSETKVLKEIAIINRGSLISSSFYTETIGIPYLRGADFSSGYLGNDKIIYIKKDFQKKNETFVKTGDIVFALIGSVGTTALVNKEFDKSFISNNIGKISPKEGILSEYLIIVLQSIIGKLQFEKEMSQTAQPKISDSQIKEFIIPILPATIQQKIADLVRRSHEARKKSKELLEEAKRKVEELIESA